MFTYGLSTRVVASQATMLQSLENGNAPGLLEIILISNRSDWDQRTQILRESNTISFLNSIILRSPYRNRKEISNYPANHLTMRSRWVKKHQRGLIWCEGRFPGRDDFCGRQMDIVLFRTPSCLIFLHRIWIPLKAKSQDVKLGDMMTYIPNRGDIVS
jgi:hypothetical protein